MNIYHKLIKNLNRQNITFIIFLKQKKPFQILNLKRNKILKYI